MAVQPVTHNDGASGSARQPEKIEIVCPEIIVDKKSGLKYRKGEGLGKGGFAKVYEFIDSRKMETLAGKVISKLSLAKPRTKQKLFSEIKIHKSVSHINIVRFIHCFEDSQNVYLVIHLCSDTYYISGRVIKSPFNICVIKSLASSESYAPFPFSGN
ncbi:MAG: putative polo kinase, partial [Streblomastix strix]